MSGYGDGGSWFEISDVINDLSKNFLQKTKTLVSTIPNCTSKKEFMPSFCKDFTMKLKHHSIPNTIAHSSLSRDFSTKSLSSDCENNWKLRRLDIKSFETEIVNAYDLDLSLYQA